MRRVVAGFALLLCCAGAVAADQQTFLGLRLDEALGLLQKAGLPIVFSSEVVTPVMRVATEPHGVAPRQQLDELLAAHGLKAERGPGGTILVVPNHTTGLREVQPKPVASTGGEPVLAMRPSDPKAAPATYTDHVVVHAPKEDAGDGGVSETTLDRRDLQTSGSAIQADGFAAVHAMPRVAGLDDFRSDFSVRGSPYRQIGIVIDGVATPWLQHTVYGRNDVGSLSMFGSDSLDHATLQVGAYPRLYQDALGAQLDLSFKEGSRDATRVTGTAGGVTTAFVGEGPVGTQGRGSWIAGVRNSYRTWPPDRQAPTDPGFDFSDVHGKFVYDVSPTQQLSVTALTGRSTLESVGESLVGPLGTGTDHANLFTVAWRSTVGSHTVVSQRAFLVSQDLVSTPDTGQAANRSSNSALGYRGEIQHAVFGGLLESGAEVSQRFGARDIEVATPTLMPGAFQATWMTHAAYLDFSGKAPRGVSFDGGVRASDSTLVHRGALDPWILGAWRVGRGWALNASAGGSHQFPDLDAVVGPAGSAALVPERATHVDVGIEQRLPIGVQWQATLFSRVENDVLRGPDLDPRLAPGGVSTPLTLERYQNAFHGVSRGIELVVTPENPGRLSGWMSYSYAITRQTDVLTQETFASDSDRRHTFNGAGAFRIGAHTSAGIVLRAASGVPIPGYFALSDGTLVVGDARNEIRLPPYVRLDGRVQRTFFSSRHAVTLFGEVVNALDRRNEGLANGLIQLGTGEAVGFSRPLAPRRVSIGIAINLSR